MSKLKIKQTIGTLPAADSGFVDLISKADGLYFRTDTGPESKIAESSQVVLNDSRIIRVAVVPGEAEFSSIKAAVDSITTASATERYIVRVGPGVYSEQPIQMKPYVHVVGVGNYESKVIPVSASQVCFYGADHSSIWNVKIDGANGVGGTGVRYNGSASGSYFKLVHCEIENCETFVKLTDSDGFCMLDANDIHIEGTFTTGFDISSTTNGTFGIFVGIFNFSQTTPENFFKVTGPATQIGLSTISAVFPDATGSGVLMSNGAALRAANCEFGGFINGLNVLNVGAASSVQMTATIMSNQVKDILVNHPGTVGLFSGIADRTKVDVNTSGSTFTTAYSGATGSVFTGSIYQGEDSDQLFNMSTAVRADVTIGKYYGGVVTEGTGLEVDVTGGYGMIYVDDSSPSGHYIKDVLWNSVTALTIPDEVELWIYVSDAGVVAYSLSHPNPLKTVVLAHLKTESGQVEFIDEIDIDMHHHGNNVEFALRRTLGPIFESGCSVSETGTRGLSVSSGSYYFGSKNSTPSEDLSATFDAYYRDGVGGWSEQDSLTQVDNTVYDSGTGTLTALTAGYYTNKFLYVVGSGTKTRYFLVHGQAQYSTLVLAEGGNLPLTPPWFSEGLVLIARIIVKQGQTSLVLIVDERPRIGFASGIASSASDHGAFTGLGDDDHLQYLPLTGIRAMTGVLDMGANAITNVGNVDGVDVSTHNARHLPNGSDPLTTASAGTIGTANSVGIANSLARSDHGHDHGSQTVGTHHAVATSSVAGFMSATDKAAFDAEVRFVSSGTQVVNGNTVWATATTFPTITLATGTYIFEAFIVAQSAATTNGLGLRLNVGTATATFIATWKIPFLATGGTASIYEYPQVSGTIPNIFSTSYAVANVNAFNEGLGQIVVTSPGTIVLQFVNEVNNTSVTLQNGCLIRIRKVA